MPHATQLCGQTRCVCVCACAGWRVALAHWQGVDRERALRGHMLCQQQQRKRQRQPAARPQHCLAFRHTSMLCVTELQVYRRPHAGAACGHRWWSCQTHPCADPPPPPPCRSSA